MARTARGMEVLDKARKMSKRQPQRHVRAGVFRRSGTNCGSRGCKASILFRISLFGASVKTYVRYANGFNPLPNTYAV